MTMRRRTGSRVSTEYPLLQAALRETLFSIEHVAKQAGLTRATVCAARDGAISQDSAQRITAALLVLAEREIEIVGGIGR